MQEEEYFVGEVEATFYSNPDNYYRVVRIRIDETNTLYSEKHIVVTGTFISLQEGTTYQFYGHLVDHDRYGVQFQMTRYEQKQVTSKEGLIRYFSSEAFPGIGKVLAERIVESLGMNALTVILNDPDQLDQVKGLTKTKRTLIKEKIKENQGDQQVFLKLAELGLSNQLAAKIYAKYGEESAEVVEDNPYLLVKALQGFGFQKADQLAQRLDFERDDPRRLTAALAFCLESLCYGSGDTKIAKNVLLEETEQILKKGTFSSDIEAQKLEDTLSDLVDIGSLIQEGDFFSLPSLSFAEKGIVRRLTQLQNSGPKLEAKDWNFDQEIQKSEEKLGIHYGPAQKEALKLALSSKVFILTGGPGTGKTTVLKGLIDCYARLRDLSLDPDAYDYGEFPIHLAAPTGRAAKRMSETTNLPASTIHRLLGLTGEEDESQVSESSYGMSIEGDLLIVDEMSMVDTWLFYQLLDQVPNTMQVILVGDQDQLPSVGPGQVLADLLASQRVVSYELDQIYRQDSRSTISLLAHTIKQGQVPKDLTQNQPDRSFFQVSYYQMADFVAQVAQRAIAKGYPKKSVQVLAPMYRGQAGIDQLNTSLQEQLNPNSDGQKREVSFFEQTFRVGDKVLQLQNQPEKNIFNGDIGEITGIFYANETDSETDELVVNFDDHEVTYLRTDFKKLTLAYCTSIHKAQGSEFSIVILPLLGQYRRMLQRNLLYTAITRAKKSLILCGEEKAFACAIQTESFKRQTGLLEKLVAEEELLPVLLVKGEEGEEEGTPVEGTLFKSSVTWLTPEMVLKGEVDPLIGMEGLSPYSM
ncbi:SF1B family DNA helicase RecD2 [Aerococcus christensenii]|uniref:SF1B family DNA helicase RecD2 n=1 Tax=Aerococcus christensenii TaxID=87541 RepID=UPI003F4201FA